MKLIHSFWTRPLEGRMYGIDRLDHLVGDVWMFALSVAYARREGFDIELHTDSLGAALLGHLPYAAVHLTLDGMPRDISPRFWAAGKMWALEAAGDGAVHIDGDVFIKDRALLDCPEGTGLIVQEIETHRDWLWNLESVAPGWDAFCAGHGIEAVQPEVNYNTGVMGLLDAGLRRDYIAAYRRFAVEATRRFGRELGRGEYLTPDLFAEQLLLYQMATGRGTATHLVLPEGCFQAPKVGFQHLVTHKKYTAVPKVRATLKRFFPNIYQATYRLCQNI